MNAHRIETVVGGNRTIILKDLPFNEGEEIEVIVLEKKNGAKNKEASALQGTLLRYDKPFESVAEESWEAINLV